VLSWHIAAVEVKLGTSDGLPIRVRKWQPDATDLWNFAEEIALFITGGGVGGATVLLRRSTTLD
jgi:hypothetical protein